MEEKKIVFVTHNKGKVASAQRCFEGSNIKLETYEYDLDEPRSDDINEIAKSKVLQAYDMVKCPCIAMDTGFFIEALNGFPRAFVNFVLDTINIEGILKLMDGEENRNCYFGECLTYYDGVEFKYFNTKIRGTLSKEILGQDTNKKWSNLWYIFVPEGYDMTLAQMNDEKRSERNNKKEISTLMQFIEWYLNRNVK